MAFHTFVNVSCANLYRNPTYHTEIDSQVILWEKLEILDKKNDFFKVVAEDGYKGWLSKYQVAETHLPDKDAFKQVTALSKNIYSGPDIYSNVVRDAGAGCLLAVQIEQGDWARLILPDGVVGWIESSAFLPMPKFSPENLIAFAKMFLGVPYFWGGKTPKGLDCSGFVQLIYKLYGVRLRRDAWMQYQDSTYISGNPENAQPGNLLFFAEDDDRLTHVGIALGDSSFIHARGMVRINSFDPSDKLCDQSLRQSFVDVRSVSN